MAIPRKVQESEFEKGDVGEAEVEFLEHGGMRVVILKDGKAAEFHVEPDGIPVYMPRKTGKAFVQMNKAGDKILYANPLNGFFDFKWSEIVHAKDQAPAPKTYNGQYGEYQAFTIKFEIVSGSWKGATMTRFHQYRFYNRDGDSGVLIGKKGSGEDLANDLEIFIPSGNIPFSENVLPMIDAMAKAAEVVAKAPVKGGRITRDGFIQISSDDKEVDAEMARATASVKAVLGS